MRNRQRSLQGSTSIGCLLFSFPLLAPLRISPRRPIGIELHVQLAFSPRQLVILGLFLAAERMPLYRTRRNMERKEKCTSTVVRDRALALVLEKQPAVSVPLDKFWTYAPKNENGQLWCSSQNLFCGRYRRASSRHRSNQYIFRSENGGVGLLHEYTVTRRLQYTEHAGGGRRGGRARPAPLASRATVPAAFLAQAPPAAALTHWSNTHTHTHIQGHGHGCSSAGSSRLVRVRSPGRRKQVSEVSGGAGGQRRSEGRGGGEASVQEASTWQSIPSCRVSA